MNNAKATLIVEAIINDLCGRRGLRQEWEAIDEEIQQELKQEWVDLVIAEMEKL